MRWQKMRKAKVGTAAICFLALIVASAEAQIWRRFTTTDGLASNRVWAIAEDGNEDLWVGTDGGLSRFDGLFTTHLSGTAIRFLLASSDHTIWAGGDGLLNYDGETWTRHRNETVYALLESRDGWLWASIMDIPEPEMIWGVIMPHLYSYDGAEWMEHEQPGNFVIGSLLESSDGMIWAGGHGLHSYYGAEWMMQRELIGIVITSLLESSDGTIWIGADNGLHSYYVAEWTEHKELESVRITSLLESSDGTIWVGADNGLHSCYGAEWTEHKELESVRITSLLESSDGTIWVGADNGLHSYYGAEWTEHEDLDGIVITSLLESSDGAIWATSEYGLYRYGRVAQWNGGPPETPVPYLFESSDGTIWAIGEDHLYSYDRVKWTEHKELGGIAITSLLESSDGTIWALGKDNVYIYDGMEWTEDKRLGDIMRNVMNDLLQGSDGVSGIRYRDPALVKNIKPGHILESSDGTIWVGTKYDLYSHDGGEWTEHEELRGTWVAFLLESSDGRIWIGGPDGIYSYNGLGWEQQLRNIATDFLQESSDSTIWAVPRHGQDDAVMRSLHSYDGIEWTEHEQLRGIMIDSLSESSDGTIWAWGDGLYSYDGGRWVEHEQVGNMEILSLIQSRDNKIWVGTSIYGVQLYDGIAWGVPHIVSDELPSYDVLSILEDSKENIWLGTDRGVVLSVPNHNSPMIDIINPLEETIETGTSSMFVEWRAGDTETESYLLLYQYRIDNSEWSEPSRISSVNTPPMDDGKHVLSVRAIDRDLNYSDHDTLTIIVDTIRPNVLISSPASDAIIGGKVVIMGGVSDSDLAEFRVEYAIGSEPSDDGFVVIHRSDQVVASGLLAEWDASSKSLPEGLYTLRLSAIDELEHGKDYSISVTLDKTLPHAKISLPEEGSRLTKKTTFIGEVNDQHLDSYILEYSTDIEPSAAIWRQIFNKTELLQAQQTEIQIRHDWEAPTISGAILIRLTAIDAAGNIQQDIVSVEVPQAVTKDTGGEVSSVDGSVSLYIPPRSLGRDTIVTINPAPMADIQSPPDSARSLHLAYDIEPADLVFNSIKPATLQIRLNDASTHNHRRIALFRWNGSEWVLLGGTVRGDKITVGIAQTGRYALMEVETDAVDLSRIGSLFTCQPRVFSPEVGQTTTISLSLQEETSVTLKVYNIDGRLQKILVSGSMYAGRNAVSWDGRDEDGVTVPSGLYIIALGADEERLKTKTVIVKNR